MYTARAVTTKRMKICHLIRVVNCCVAAQTSTPNTDNAYIGEIRIFVGNSVPTGWLPCNGQFFPVKTYAVLFPSWVIPMGWVVVETFAIPNLTGECAGVRAKGRG